MTYDEEGLGDGYLDSNILLEVKKLHVAICQYLFEKNKEKEHGVVPNPLQMRILKYLKREEKESIYQKDIQKNLDVSKAAISAVIKSMEKKKLIQKLPSKIDARKTKIEITEEGKKVLEEIEIDMKKINQKVLEQISKEELEEFIKISHKIKESLKKEGTK